MATQTCVTAQDVMDYGRIDNADLHATITTYLASVFAAAQDYCSRKFSSDTFTEYHDVPGPLGGAALLVENPPITTLTSLTDDNNYGQRAITVATNVISASEYFDRGEVRLYKSEGYFATGRVAAKVVYVGGWTASTMPTDLKEAICQEVLFRINYPEAVGLAAAAGDGVNNTYATRNGFAAQVCDVLDRYRQLWRTV